MTKFSAISIIRGGGGAKKAILTYSVAKSPSVRPPMKIT